MAPYSGDITATQWIGNDCVEVNIPAGGPIDTAVRSAIGQMFPNAKAQGYVIMVLEWNAANPRQATFYGLKAGQEDADAGAPQELCLDHHSCKAAHSLHTGCPPSSLASIPPPPHPASYGGPHGPRRPARLLPEDLSREGSRAPSVVWSRSPHAEPTSHLRYRHHQPHRRWPLSTCHALVPPTRCLLHWATAPGFQPWMVASPSIPRVSPVAVPPEPPKAPRSRFSLSSERSRKTVPIPEPPVDDAARCDEAEMRAHRLVQRREIYVLFAAAYGVQAPGRRITSLRLWWLCAAQYLDSFVASAACVASRCCIQYVPPVRSVHTLRLMKAATVYRRPRSYHPSSLILSILFRLSSVYRPPTQIRFAVFPIACKTTPIRMSRSKPSTRRTALLLAAKYRYPSGKLINTRGPSLAVFNHELYAEILLA
ncbi:hypothetical protein MKEN_01467000 [Mycena kentingensis (nom. inval.)]|nr:hypothetical protein MKEN_01467000 [Mycena kentingensis (nom. inval.)]